MARAAAGRVRVLYDWWGSSDVPGGSCGGRASMCASSPRPASPTPSASSTVTIRIDGDYAALGGSRPLRPVHPGAVPTPSALATWRCGRASPAVADLERHFAVVGTPSALPADERPAPPAPAGGVAARRRGRGRVDPPARAGRGAGAGLDRRRHFLGVPLLREALMAAARDGVDVRVLQSPARVGTAARGHRPLLEAGVRIFERQRARTPRGRRWPTAGGAGPGDRHRRQPGARPDRRGPALRAVLEAGPTAGEIRLTPAPGGSRVARSAPRPPPSAGRAGAPGRRERPGRPPRGRAGAAGLAAAGAAARGRRRGAAHPPRAPGRRPGRAPGRRVGRCSAIAHEVVGLAQVAVARSGGRASPRSLRRAASGPPARSAGRDSGRARESSRAQEGGVGHSAEGDRAGAPARTAARARPRAVDVYAARLALYLALAPATPSGRSPPATGWPRPAWVLALALLPPALARRRWPTALLLAGSAPLLVGCRAPRRRGGAGPGDHDLQRRQRGWPGPSAAPRPSARAPMSSACRSCRRTGPRRWGPTRTRPVLRRHPVLSRYPIREAARLHLYPSAGPAGGDRGRWSGADGDRTRRRRACTGTALRGRGRRRRSPR